VSVVAVIRATALMNWWVPGLMVSLVMALGVVTVPAFVQLPLFGLCILAALLVILPAYGYARRRADMRSSIAR
jgi:hypothetical protein